MNAELIGKMFDNFKLKKMLQFDLKIENIPFLVDERNHNIDAIKRIGKS